MAHLPKWAKHSEIGKIHNGFSQVSFSDFLHAYNRKELIVYNLCSV